MRTNSPLSKPTTLSVHRDQSGMTLVEVLIAAGLTMIIALAISSLFVEMNQQQEQTKEKADIFSMQQQLTYDLKYRPLPTP